MRLKYMIVDEKMKRCQDRESGLTPFFFTKHCHLFFCSFIILLRRRRSFTRPLVTFWPFDVGADHCFHVDSVPVFRCRRS